MLDYNELDAIQYYNLCLKKMKHVDRLMGEYNITREEVSYDNVPKRYLPAIDKLLKRIARCIAIQREELHPLKKSQKQLRKEADRSQHHDEFIALYKAINKRSAVTHADLVIDYESSLYTHNQISEEEVIGLIRTTVSGRVCTDFHDDLMY